MPTDGPGETVDRLVQAINRADLEGALALYEPEAVMVVEPGQIVRGTPELREALEAFIALSPTLRSQAQQVIEAGELASYVGRWALRGTDSAGRPVIMGGESSNILRRQANGHWLIVLDNPWGARILPSR
jgi:uncharacterized protein (TIGR02246 family)